MRWKMFLVVVVPFVVFLFLSVFPRSPEKFSGLSFTEVVTPFIHVWNQDAYPFLGGSAFDMDGDGSYEIFVGGGKGQDDVLLTYRDGEFRSIHNPYSSKDATYGVLSLDINNDSKVDLIIARQTGVYIYDNNGSNVKLDLPLGGDEPFHVAAGDVNRDGFVDLYVSTFIAYDEFEPASFNDLSVRSDNYLLVNRGDNTFNLQTLFSQNTFQAAFLDLNNDGWQDLVVSPNTDRVRVFENVGGTLVQHNPVSDYGYWMGFSFTDLDGDNDLDLFFSNIGNFAPVILNRGDLGDSQVFDSDWLLLRNEGDFNFTKLDEFKGYPFAWGSVFVDLDGDSRQDLVVANNFVGWLPHYFAPTTTNLVLNKEFFYSVSGLDNPFFGQAPLIVDFNQDGSPDVLWLNKDGPLRAFINNQEGFVKTSLPDSVSSIGRYSGNQPFVPGGSFMVDSSPEFFS